MPHLCLPAFIPTRLPASRPDLPHHLQRRPGAGAANASQPISPRALHPAAERSGRSIRRRIFSLDPDGHLDRVSYDGAVDEASVLRRSVGKRLVFRLSDPRDTVSALVLGVDPLRLQLPDGR